MLLMTRGDKACPVPDRWCVQKAETSRVSGAERVKPLLNKGLDSCFFFLEGNERKKQN